MKKYFRRTFKRFVSKRINRQLNDIPIINIPMLVILILLFGGGAFKLGYLGGLQATVMKAVPWSAKTVSTTAKGMARVHFIDVGQGDATLIQTENKNILVDTGEDSHEEKLLGYLETVGVDQLEYLILTHPDADHIGNASVLLQNMQVGKIIMPDKTTDTLSYKQVMSTIQERSIEVIYPTVGDTYQVEDMNVIILAPNTQMLKTDDTNDASIGIKVVHGTNSYIMTGDAGEASEGLMCQEGIDLEADVLKCGHHGSATSTSQQFLKKVDPTYAIISCGKENKYGHPHQEVLSNLQDNDVQIYRTDELGTVVAEDDGNTVKWGFEKGE